MKARDVAVVGGGLGGLAAAALLARGGCAVTVYERSKQLGGRAHTSEVGGFRFNLGPHALYRAGAGMRVLGRLSLSPRGGVPGATGGHAIREGRLWTLPGGPVSLMTTDLLGLAGKLELARVLARLGRVETEGLAGVGTRAWLEAHVRSPEAREVVAGLMRLSSYSADLEALSAEAALTQLQLALSRGVLYVDGGWSTLVEALAEAAREAGARVVTSSRVEAVEAEGQVRGVRLADGTVHAADAVVVAGSPGDVAALLPGDAELAREAREAVPVRAATLELGLSGLPRPRALFGLGLDGPWYVSVHSHYARLGPEGGAMVHVAKYLTAADAEPSEAELEGVLELLQPGWREHLKVKRFRPALTVSHALPRAVTGGLAGRPSVEVGHMPGLYRVGDWVGREGMLADATLASAEVAAEAVLRDAAQPRRTPRTQSMEARA
jgi:phytoene dehydrogenase-like protein